MRSIAGLFGKEMDRVVAFLETISIAYQLAKENPTGITSKKKFIENARRLRKVINSCTDMNVVAYDGAYLHACAEYELTVRYLIERYVDRAASKCQDYLHLPKEMREWYPVGCSSVVLNITQDKFRHLTVSTLVSSLASTTKRKKYSLIGDAFSDNSVNIWPETIDEMFRTRIGIEKIWQKLSRENGLQTALGTTVPATAEQVARRKLSALLHRRNDIIHRGKTYYAPSETEVRECALFFKALVANLSEIMEKHCAAL